MSNSILIFLAVFAAAPSGSASPAGADTPAKSPFAFRQIGPTGLELSESGKPVFVYNFGMVLRRASPRPCAARPTCTRSTPPTAPC